MSDQLDDDFMTDQRATTPILGNVREHAMFDFVPFAGSWGKVTDWNRHS